MTDLHLLKLPKFTNWDKDNKKQIFNQQLSLEALEYLLPWSKDLPKKCYKARR